MFRILTFVCLLFSSFVASAQSQYQYFGQRPLRIVVPFNAGGYADNLARIVSEGISNEIRQPVIVENRPGGFVVVGAHHMLNQPSDGHMIMITGNGLTAVRRFNPNLSIDLLKEVSIASVIVKTPLVTVASRTSGIIDANQFINRIRSSPESLSFVSMGGGGIAGMGVMVFLDAINGKMLNVPYSGYAPATVDFAAGRIDIMSVEVPAARQLVDAGGRPLIISSSTRRSSFPDVPTWKELNIDNEFYAFQAFWVKSNTPRPIRQELNRIIMASINQTEIRKKLETLGIESQDISNPNDSLEQHESMISNEIKRWPAIH
jgi:tripartite-type tricarboxylate transporter receptor subunit TctC